MNWWLIGAGLYAGLWIALLMDPDGLDALRRMIQAVTKTVLTPLGWMR